MDSNIEDAYSFLCKFVNNVVNIKPEIPQNRSPDGYSRLILENQDFYNLSLLSIQRV